MPKKMHIKFTIIYCVFVFFFFRLLASLVCSFFRHVVALCLCALVENGKKRRKKRLLYVETRFFSSPFGGIVLLPSLCKYVWRERERKIAHALIESSVQRKKSQWLEDWLLISSFLFFCVKCFKRFEQYLNCVQSERQTTTNVYLLTHTIFCENPYLFRQTAEEWSTALYDSGNATFY